MTASFLKELLRAGALRAADDGRDHVGDEDLAAVLDQLASEGAALTRVLLGGERPAGGPDPHAWLAGGPS